MLSGVFKEFQPERHVTEPPFPRIPFKESMLKYGNDKPDLRNPLIISDVTEAFRESGFGLFAKNIDKGSVVRAILATGAAANRAASSISSTIGRAKRARVDWGISSLKTAKRKVRLRVTSKPTVRQKSKKSPVCPMVMRYFCVRQGSGCGQVRRCRARPDL